jgi:HPt (histidine-containing phosphotransfer) domain-containing protein/two-component sensor histidine kinase/PAS domain-containing protein
MTDDATPTTPDAHVLLEAGRDIARAFHIDSVAFALCRAALLSTGMRQGMIAHCDASGRWSRHGAARLDDGGQVRISRPMGIPRSLVKGELPADGQPLRVGEFLAFGVEAPEGHARLVLQGDPDLAPTELHAFHCLRESAEAAWQNIANFERLEAVVSEEITRAGDQTAALQLILDSMHDGVLLTDLQGLVQPTHSAALVNWFGYPPPDVTLWDYLCHDDPVLAEALELGFDQLGGSFLPFEVAAAQLPSRLWVDGRPFDLAYHAIHKHGHLAGVSVTVSDARAVVANEQSERRHQELLAVTRHLVRDRAAAHAALDEIGSLTQALHRSTGETRRRHLHTLKGCSAAFGLLDLAASAHRAEDALLEGVRADEALSDVVRQWRDTQARLEPLLGRSDSVQVSPSALQRLRHLLTSDGPEQRRAALQELDSWSQASFSGLFSLLTDTLPEQARGQGKRVRVTLDHRDMHLPVAEWEPFVRSLTHVVRNAVVHGIEEPMDRLASGKAEVGTLHLAVERRATGLRLTIDDDGRGIDWEAVRARAADAGLPHDHHDDLVAALFHDGVSTREQADDMAGRGVGMAAVDYELRAIGGSVQITTEPGEGTRWVFDLPFPALEQPSECA